jgi:hypothetical protein
MAQILSFPDIEPRVYPKILSGDLAIALHNQQLTRWDVRNILGQLNEHDQWGFIVPRLMLTALTVEYDMAELPLEGMAERERSAYQALDAVMVKSRVTLQ